MAAAWPARNRELDVLADGDERRLAALGFRGRFTVTVFTGTVLEARE